MEGMPPFSSEPVEKQQEFAREEAPTEEQVNHLKDLIADLAKEGSVEMEGWVNSKSDGEVDLNIWSANFPASAKADPWEKVRQLQVRYPWVRRGDGSASWQATETWGISNQGEVEGVVGFDFIERLPSRETVASESLNFPPRVLGELERQERQLGGSFEASGVGSTHSGKVSASAEDAERLIDLLEHV